MQLVPDMHILPARLVKYASSWLIWFIYEPKKPIVADVMTGKI